MLREEIKVAFLLTASCWIATEVVAVREAMWTICDPELVNPGELDNRTYTRERDLLRYGVESEALLPLTT